MSVTRVKPKEAAKLLAEGWQYVDVRSIPEFEGGHPPGAFNVPLMHFTPGQGMSPNPRFGEVMAARFPREQKLVIGCKAGGRSNRAAQLLLAAGYTQVVDMAGGWEGEDGVPGWRPEGLPVEKETPAGHGWEALSK
jgi:rhodanese-related sulfurtransferase